MSELPVGRCRVHLHVSKDTKRRRAPSRNVEQAVMDAKDACRSCTLVRLLLGCDVSKEKISHAAGTTVAHVTRVQRGNAALSAAAFARLCRAMGMELDEARYGIDVFAHLKEMLHEQLR